MIPDPTYYDAVQLVIAGASLLWFSLGALTAGAVLVLVAVFWWRANQELWRP
jgi:hypothetical protein